MKNPDQEKYKQKYKGKMKRFLIFSVFFILPVFSIYSQSFNLPTWIDPLMSYDELTNATNRLGINLERSPNGDYFYMNNNVIHSIFMNRTFGLTYYAIMSDNRYLNFQNALSYFIQTYGSPSLIDDEYIWYLAFDDQINVELSLSIGTNYRWTCIYYYFLY